MVKAPPVLFRLALVLSWTGLFAVLAMVTAEVAIGTPELQFAERVQELELDPFQVSVAAYAANGTIATVPASWVNSVKKKNAMLGCGNSPHGNPGLITDVVEVIAYKYNKVWIRLRWPRSTTSAVTKLSQLKQPASSSQLNPQSPALQIQPSGGAQGKNLC
jgi:hypothetical protein